jgi:diguanylate cyclase (GGDEF)-like protein
MQHSMPSAAGSGLQQLATAIGRIGMYVADMRERMRLLEAVVENFPGGISLFDQDLNMVLCNQQQRVLLDYPQDLFADGYPSMETLFRFNAARGEYGSGDIEEQVGRRLALVRQCEPHVYERVRPNGTVLEVRGVPIEGGGFVTTYFDVTEQHRNRATIAHMALHDVLTDLPNRMLFTDRLQSAIALARRTGMMAVHCLDLDHFKPVNDNFGHQAGDELLIGVAKRLCASVRDNDTVARLGGDEFAIVQTGIRDLADAAVLARRVLGQFAQPFEVAGREVRVGVSIGIALAPQDGISVDEVLVKADSALYRSKHSGRGRFCFHGGS